MKQKGAIAGVFLSLEQALTLFFSRVLGRPFEELSTQQSIKTFLARTNKKPLMQMPRTKKPSREDEPKWSEPTSHEHVPVSKSYQGAGPRKKYPQLAILLRTPSRSSKGKSRKREVLESYSNENRLEKKGV